MDRRNQYRPKTYPENIHYDYEYLRLNYATLSLFIAIVLISTGVVITLPTNWIITTVHVIVVVGSMVGHSLFLSKKAPGLALQAVAKKIITK